MKRFGIAITTVFAATLFVGCGGGLDEGMPTQEEASSPQPAGLKQMMEAQGKNMQMKNQGPPKKKAGGTP